MQPAERTAPTATNRRNGRPPMSRSDRAPSLPSRRQLMRLGVAGAALLAAPRGGAFAAGTLKVAAVFGTPIEEPWVNAIHVALLRAKKELGVDYTWSENVKASDFGRV